MRKNWHLWHVGKALLATVVAASLVACSSSGGRPKPAELAPLVPLIGVKQVWVNPLGASGLPISMSVHAGKAAVASGNGVVAMVDTQTGADLWRLQLSAPLAAGVGSDGHMAAVVSTRNELVAVVAGREVWRQPLGVASYTAPLVAGQRVFVLGGDRSVTAYDGNSGARLWTQSRTGDPLVLQQPGVLMAVGDTLVVGLGGRMVGFSPSNGAIRWEAPLATARGINDIERMVDLVAPISRLDGVVCARSFQTAVGCVDAVRGRVLWSKPADGAQGIHGDEKFIFASESNGRIMAWNRVNGDVTWTNDQLMHRQLSAPLVLGRSVALGDATGTIHLLSRENGSFLARLPTDGSAIVSAPALADDTLLVLTQNGNLFAWRPQ